MGAARRERSRKEASFLDVIRSELRELKFDIASIKAILDTGGEMFNPALAPPPAPPPLDVFDKEYLLRVRQLTLNDDTNSSMPSQTHIAWSPEGLVYVQEPFLQHRMDLLDNASSRLIVTIKEDILKGRDISALELTAQPQQAMPTAFSTDEIRKLPIAAWEPFDLEKIQLFSFGEEPSLDWHVREFTMAIATAVPYDDFDFQEVIEMPPREPPVLIDNEKFAVFQRLSMEFLRKYSSDGEHVPITASIGCEFESALRDSGVLDDCQHGVLLEVNHLAQLIEGQTITMEIVGAFFSTISNSLRAKGKEFSLVDSYFEVLKLSLTEDAFAGEWSEFLIATWDDYESYLMSTTNSDMFLHRPMEEIFNDVRLILPYHESLPENDAKYANRRDLYQCCHQYAARILSPS